MNEIRIHQLCSMHFKFKLLYLKILGILSALYSKMKINNLRTSITTKILAKIVHMYHRLIEFHKIFRQAIFGWHPICTRRTLTKWIMKTIGSSSQRISTENCSAKKCVLHYQFMIYTMFVYDFWGTPSLLNGNLIIERRSINFPNINYFN